MSKTIAQTPAPASDRIKGSKVNKKGSATAKSSSSIQLSSVTIGTLKRKLEEFKKSNPQNKKVTLNDLKAVYRRGSGAYSSSHRPTITGGAPNSRAAWSYARVNKFLEKAAGKKVKAAYVQDDDLLKYEEGGLTARSSRRFIPSIRGTWNEAKILKYLKSRSSDTGTTYGISKVINDFDSSEELADHIYYHGTTNYFENGLMPSITLTERQAESMGGGGYGQRYWGVSLTKKKKVAESFSGQSSYVNIYPVILKSDAKVIVREDLQDASDIEDIIVDLYNSGVDAVWIGGGEQELVLINPYAAVVYKDGRKQYQVYGGFKSKQLTKDEIENIYKKGKDIYEDITNRLRGVSGKDERVEILNSRNELVFKEGGELDKKITCINCGWHWKESQTEQADKYICHKCGFDNTLFYPLDKYVDGGKIEEVMAKPVTYTLEDYPEIESSKNWLSEWQLNRWIKEGRSQEYIQRNIEQAKNEIKILTERTPFTTWFLDLPKGKYKFEVAKATYEIKKDIRKEMVELGWKRVFQEKSYWYVVKTNNVESPFDSFISPNSAIKSMDEYEKKAILIESINRTFKQLIYAGLRQVYKNDVKMNISNYPLPNTYAKGGKLKGTGDCYYMAGQFAMDNVFTPKKIEYIGTPYLVHAEVRGQGKIEGLRYGHAWIEDDENVYDFSNNRELIVPKVVYYAIGNIETSNPKKYVRYTFPEARQKMLKTKNYGCWDLDVEYADGGEIISKLKTPKTLTEISSIHGVDEVTLQIQLEKGIAAEKEHTDDEIIAKTIALHHIEEMPDYYDRLAKMEEEQADAGIPISVFEPKIMQKEFSEGGVVVGKRHSESDDFGTGERFVIKSTGQIVEVEGGEGVICKASMESDKQYKFDGKSMTGREVASFLNHKYGGVEFAKGGKIKGDDHVCGCTNYYHGGELPSATLENLNGGEAVITVKTMESKDIYNFQGVKMTPRQILSHINTQAGGKRFEDGGIIDISKTKFDNLNKMTKMVYFTENILYS